MNPLTLTPEMAAAAKKAVWFETPDEAVRHPARLAAYVMTYGDADDWAELRRQLDPAGLCAALDAAPPGILDARSWAYWNLIAGRPTPPPMPERGTS
jgi:hypothetical protein